MVLNSVRRFVGDGNSGDRDGSVFGQGFRTVTRATTTRESSKLDSRQIEPSYEAEPFLARFAIPRTGDDQLPGYYSTELDMWVVDTTDGPAPVISQGALAELVTKTKVNAEQDDEGFYALHELKTFTDVKAEGTDSSDCMNQLLELSSKTFIKVESDDAGDHFNHLFELVTKTNTQQERDDSSDPALGLDSRYFEG